MAKLEYFKTESKMEYFYKEEGALLVSTGVVRFSSLVDSWEVEFSSQKNNTLIWIYNPDLARQVELLRGRGLLKVIT